MNFPFCLLRIDIIGYSYVFFNTEVLHFTFKLTNYSYKDINKIAEWMNNYPRKILNYKTPLEALQEEFNDNSILNKIYKLQEKINCL